MERGTTMARNNREMRRKHYIYGGKRRKVVERGTSMAGNSRGNCEGRSSLRLGIARRFDRSDTRERKRL